MALRSMVIWRGSHVTSTMTVTALQLSAVALASPPPVASVPTRRSTNVKDTNTGSRTKGAEPLALLVALPEAVALAVALALLEPLGVSAAVPEPEEVWEDVPVAVPLAVPDLEEVGEGVPVPEIVPLMVPAADELGSFAGWAG